MIYIGMDVHQKSTVFCFYDSSLEKDQRYRLVTRPTTRAAYEEVLRPFQGRCKIAFEVGTQAQWVAAIVRPLAVEVQVAHAGRIPWLFRDGRKNDFVDAQKLATLLALDQIPAVHLPSVEVSGWRKLIHHRRNLVSARCRVKCRIRAILRSISLVYPKKNCWTKAGQAWLRALGLDESNLFVMHGLLDELKFLDDQIQSLEEKLNAIANQDSRVALLRTIPGVGARTAESIVAFTDVVQRFNDRKRFTSYFGMTPTEDSSGSIRRHGHISKRGPGVVRWLIGEAAHQVIRRCPEMKTFYERVRRGQKDRKKKAVVAVGRKVLAIAYAMLKHNVAFDAGKVTQAA